jgi:hypothetical protein
VFFQQLPFYYLIDICGVRMSGSRKRDFSLFGEGYDDEFEVEKTNDWDCDCLDLEDDGLDGILSQSLDLFAERRISLERPNQIDSVSERRCNAPGKSTLDRKGENCLS